MMDIAFDSPWCPVCSRQILPKRIQVPVAPPPPPSPAPPPSSPTLQTKTASDAPSTRLARGKNGTIRARAGGLVHGTGRVKPNGTIKRSPNKEPSPTSTKKSPEPPAPTAPVRHRTVIDQGPIPLYCSDECRLADLQSSYGTSLDYHPDRHASPPLPPVPHNSWSDLSESDSSSDSVTQSTIRAQFTRPKFEVSKGPYTTARAYAHLASIYDLPPCPPPPPLLRSDTNSSNESVSNDYQSGAMMAARRIEAALCPSPPKRSVWDAPTATPTTQYVMGSNSRSEVIPGWTDGSDEWRASVYSFCAPRDSSKPRSHEDSKRAYKTFVATSHRSRGVYSTLTESSIAAGSSTPSLPGPNSRSTSEVDHLVNKFSESLARRSESRVNMAAQHALSTSPTGSTRSLPTVSGSHRRREVPLLKPGAEGKLLVPNVKMRRTSSTASSLDGASTSGSFSHTMSRVKSPLSRQNSDMSVEESDDDHMQPLSFPIQERAPEVRSWSYSDLLTYPIMQLPPKMERRIEKKTIDGVTREIEVEVPVMPERKRLFLFPGKTSMPSASVRR